MDDELAGLERAVVAQAPPGAVVVGVSISPDGRNGAALTALPTAGDYLMDDVFQRVSDRWEQLTGGSGGGVCWTSLGEPANLGVLRFAGEAPRGASTAWVAYEGEEYRVPIRHGYFLFVAWNAPYREEPQLLRLG